MSFLDFTFGEDEEKFRANLRHWITRNLPKNWSGAGFALPSSEEEAKFFKDWERKLYEAGYAGLSWPKEYGGKGLPPSFDFVFVEEIARAQAPYGMGYFGRALVGPTLMEFGSDEQKKRYLQKILSAQEFWCQGFSEPGAGSDLASLKTSANLGNNGKEFIINGEKIWTSGARYADFCLLLARTDTTAPKHKGLSYLIVDMKENGIKVSPIVMLTGETRFNQVLFENVRVPRENLVGELNKGWKEAMITMSHERGVTTIAYERQLFVSALQQAIDLTHSLQREGKTVSENSVVRQRVAQFYIESLILKFLNFKHLSRLLKDGSLGPESSILKLYWSEMYQRFGEFMMDLLGEKSTVVEGEDSVDEGKWQKAFLFSRGATIYAGTSEIQRNVISELVLQMPRIKGGD